MQQGIQRTVTANSMPRRAAQHPAPRQLAAVAIAPGLVHLAMGASLTGPDSTTMPPCVFASKSRCIINKPNLEPGRNSLICTVAAGAAVCRHHGQCRARGGTCIELPQVPPHMQTKPPDAHLQLAAPAFVCIQGQPWNIKARLGGMHHIICRIQCKARPRLYHHLQGGEGWFAAAGCCRAPARLWSGPHRPHMNTWRCSHTQPHSIATALDLAH